MISGIITEEQLMYMIEIRNNEQPQLHVTTTIIKTIQTSNVLKHGSNTQCNKWLVVEFQSLRAAYPGEAWEVDFVAQQRQC